MICAVIVRQGQSVTTMRNVGKVGKVRQGQGKVVWGGNVVDRGLVGKYHMCVTGVQRRIDSWASGGLEEK